MKKTCMLAIALLALALPAAGMAQGLPDFLSAAGEGIAQGMEAASQSLAQELELGLTMTADGARIEAGQTRVLTVTATNPRAADTPVTLTLALPERLSCAQKTAWDAVLPAAQIGEDGELVPSVTTFTRALTLVPGGGSETAQLICEMSMGTRFYRARQELALCVADISVTAELEGAQDGRVQPGDAFLWRVTARNDGTAGQDVELNVVLPDGVTLVNEEDCTLRRSGGRLTGKVHAAAAGAAVVELDLQVNEDALAGDEDAMRLMTGALYADGERVPLPRVQVCGPKINARLVPDTDALKAGEETTLRVLVTNEGLAAADVSIACALPAGLTLVQEKARTQEATPAEGAVPGDPNGALPSQGVPASGTLLREQRIIAAEDGTLTLTAHMDAASEGESGVTASTQVFELTVRAEEPQENLREKLVGTSLAYSVDGGQTQLSEAAVMRVYRPTFLGITKEDWNGIFWASLLLLVTVVCLYAAVRSDHDKEDYCYD